MEFHEVADIFPLMSDAELDELAKDIKDNTLHEAIWTYEGKIIDGRNRYLACDKVGVKPKYREWNGKGSLVAFVVSMNLHRRHLTVTQRAVAAVEIKPRLEKEARERQREHGNTAPGRKTLTEKIQEVKGESAEQAAEIFNVNPHYVYDAERIKDKAPDLFEQMKTGEMPITEAKRELAKRETKEEPPLPTDKYRVIYADPPWKYGNSGGEIDQYGPAERHYQPLTITELCSRPIKELAEDNAVLFLWVTSPMLDVSFKVIKEWGFEYKTSFVWDKIKHNFGHYNSVRHEFLLICTRGSCTPDIDEKIDSVQSIERSDEHSEKPQEFRAIIDKLYTHGKRIELFARGKFDGWDVWGNECQETQD